MPTQLLYQKGTYRRSCTCRIVVCSLILNYILANAAVSRSFAPYLASLCNKPDDFFLVNTANHQLDFWAFGLCIGFSLLLCYGIKESKNFNNGAPPSFPCPFPSQSFACIKLSSVHSCVHKRCLGSFFRGDCTKQMNALTHTPMHDRRQGKLISICVSPFRAVTTVIHITLVVFIIIAGLTQASASNYSPFAPFGARGVFNGASIVFFSYIGFDAIVNTAEEVMHSSPPQCSTGSGHALTLLHHLVLACAPGASVYCAGFTGHDVSK